jgi:hypothetical protein
MNFFVRCLTLLACACALHGQGGDAVVNKEHGELVFFNEAASLKVLPQIKGLSIPFFSQRGEVYVMFTCAELCPAKVNMGPFRVALAGVTLSDVAFEFKGVPISLADWRHFLEFIDALGIQRFNGKVMLKFPEDHVHELSRFPKVQNDVLLLETSDGHQFILGYNVKEFKLYEKSN